MADNVTTPPATDYSGVREYIGGTFPFSPTLLSGITHGAMSR